MFHLCIIIFIISCKMILICVIIYSYSTLFQALCLLKYCLKYSFIFIIRYSIFYSLHSKRGVVWCVKEWKEFKQFYKFSKILSKQLNKWHIIIWIQHMKIDFKNHLFMFVISMFSIMCALSSISANSYKRDIEHNKAVSVSISYL